MYFAKATLNQRVGPASTVRPAFIYADTLEAGEVSLLFRKVETSPIQIRTINGRIIGEVAPSKEGRDFANTTADN